jgi:hypothetical protein
MTVAVTWRRLTENLTWKRVAMKGCGLFVEKCPGCIKDSAKILALSLINMHLLTSIS